jgi:hypothetical protein
MQTSHKIAPDIPLSIIQKFDCYDWKQVQPEQIKKMLEYLKSVIGFLPEKPPSWSFSGTVPLITLCKGCAIPQLAFDWLNTRDWAQVSHTMITMILEQADSYFAKAGVPKRSAEQAPMRAPALV